MLGRRLGHASVEQQVRGGRGAGLGGAGSQEVLLLKQAHLTVVEQQPLAFVLEEVVHRLLLRVPRCTTAAGGGLLSHSGLFFQSSFRILAQADGFPPFGALSAGCFLRVRVAGSQLITGQTPLASQESHPPLGQLLASCFTQPSPGVQVKRHLSVIVARELVFLHQRRFALLLFLLRLWAVPWPQLDVSQVAHADVSGVVAAADGDAAVHDDGKKAVVLPLCSRGLRAPLLQGQGQGGLQGGVHFGQPSVGVQPETETEV